MRFSTLLVSACVAAAAVLASPIATVKQQAGCVTDADGKVYDLNNTGVLHVRVITNDREDGYYIRPVRYYVAADHVCAFYKEATHGVGGLIGEFKGPVDASFGADWAAFYECWNPSFLKAREAECGFVVAPDSSLMPLNVKEGKTRFEDVNEQLVIPVYYNVSEHCQCDFFVQNNRGGPSPPFPVTGASIGEFGIYRSWAYTCKVIWVGGPVMSRRDSSRLPN